MKGNFIFFNTNPITNMILSSGITAADYINGLEELPDNIILLDNSDDVPMATIHIPSSTW